MFSCVKEKALERMGFYDPLTIGYQCIQLGLVFIGWIGVLAITHYHPGFFQYPFFEGDITWEVIRRFWLLFVIGIAIPLIYGYFFGTYLAWNRGLPYRITVIVIRAIAEELGKRYVYICYAMILILFANDHLTTIIRVAAGGAFLLFVLPLIWNYQQGNWKGIVGSIIAFGLVIFPTQYFGEEPIYWLYERAIIPFIDFVSFGTLHSHFYDSDLSKLFVFGMVSTGIISLTGLISGDGEWLSIGMEFLSIVFLYAMLQYGLPTAIVVHILYNILWVVGKYVHEL